MNDLEIRSDWPGGSLELRQSRESGAAEFVMNFPYGLDNMATISDRGQVRKEYFVSRAFRYAIENKARDISVLRGHDFNQTLGSRSAGNAKFDDTVAGFEVILELPATVEQTIAQQQFVLEFRQHLLRGVSPGFRIPPAGTVRDAVKLIPEPGNPGILIREIREAVLSEVSAVARPAYGKTGLAQRSEGLEIPDTDLEHYRWL